MMCWCTTACCWILSIMSQSQTMRCVCLFSVRILTTVSASRRWNRIDALLIGPFVGIGFVPVSSAVCAVVVDGRDWMAVFLCLSFFLSPLLLWLFSPGTQPSDCLASFLPFSFFFPILLPSFIPWHPLARRKHNTIHYTQPEWRPWLLFPWLPNHRIAVIPTVFTSIVAMATDGTTEWFGVDGTRLSLVVLFVMYYWGIWTLWRQHYADADEEEEEDFLWGKLMTLPCVQESKRE